MKTYLINPALLMLSLISILSCNKDDNDFKEKLPVANAIVLKSEYDTKTINNRSFAIDLFKTTVANSNGDNIFISPYSVNTALNMLWNGAAGETEEELKVVLGNTIYTCEDINDYSKTLTSAFLNIDPSTDIKIANSIWADNTTPFLPSFVTTNKTWYNAEAKNVDFKKSATLADIDKWCKNNTGGKIDRITDDITVDTKFALINAIYFKAIWRDKFRKSDTRRENFTNQDGNIANIDMMNQRNDFEYNDDDTDWKMLKMPYGNKAFSMVILMPLNDEPLDTKIESLTAEKYFQLVSKMDTYSVAVKLPKFKAEYSYDLHKEILPQMGIRKVFDPNEADLSEMSAAPMYVNMVKHKTYIDVYEEGTEAAAVTAVSGECMRSEERRVGKEC